MGEEVLQQARLFVLACSVACAGCATSVGSSIPAPSGQPLQVRGLAPLAGSVRTVVLDVGHGGHDPGTSHYGLKEKSLALEIAKELRDRLREHGLRVVMTRETDGFVPLSGRAAVANRLQADLFVSVHVNANRNRRIAGTEVYYPRVSEVSSGAEWPPSVAPSEVATPSTTVKQVLWDLVLRRMRFQSRRVASAVCRSMRSNLNVPCRWIKPARFVVLRQAWMPAVLVEVGYLTNREEASRLASAAYRQEIAQAIADSIIAYFRDVETQHI
jgi:N-acetylmuramoyl-L-alanine amidase